MIDAESPRLRRLLPYPRQLPQKLPFRPIGFPVQILRCFPDSLIPVQPPGVFRSVRTQDFLQQDIDRDTSRFVLDQKLEMHSATA